MDSPDSGHLYLDMQEIVDVVIVEYPELFHERCLSLLARICLERIGLSHGFDWRSEVINTVAAGRDECIALKAD